MGKIRDFIKRISLTQWLLFAVIVFLALILVELWIINETLLDILTSTQLNRPRISF